MTHNITTRASAREAGQPTFFTGQACQNNHISLRRVSNGVCIACAEAWRATNKPHAVRQMRAGTGKRTTRSIELHVEPATYELTAALKDRFRTILGRSVSGSVLHRSGLRLLADKLDRTKDAKAALELVV